jgi:hypothetical protein
VRDTKPGRHQTRKTPKKIGKMLAYAPRPLASTKKERKMGNPENL